MRSKFSVLHLLAVITTLLWLKIYWDLFFFIENIPREVMGSFNFSEYFFEFIKYMPLTIYLGRVGSIVVIGFSVFFLFVIEPFEKGKLPLISKLTIGISLISTVFSCAISTLPFDALSNSFFIRISYFIYLLNILQDFFVVPAIILILLFGLRIKGSIYLIYFATLILLIPTDPCANPFCLWWLVYTDYSPMQYLPAVTLILFAIGLRNFKIFQYLLFVSSIAYSFFAFHHFFSGGYF